MADLPVGSWWMSCRRAARCRRGLQQPGEGPQQRRLAAGVGADDDGDLPGRDRRPTGRRRPPGRRRRGAGPGRERGRRRRLGRQGRHVVDGRGPRPVGGGDVVERRLHGHPPRPTRLARASSQSRYGAPTTPVTTPTGSSVGANSRRATRSEQQHEQARRRAPPAPTASGRARQAAGDRRRRRARRSRSARRRGGDRGRGRRRRAGARSRLRSTRDAEAPRGVVAELQDAQRAEQATTTGSSTSVGDADRAHVLPAPAVEAAGEPHDGPLGLEDLGPGQQVRRDAGQERR